MSPFATFPPVYSSNVRLALLDSFQTWAPDLCNHYEETKEAIRVHHESLLKLKKVEALLDIISGNVESPFAAMTANFGPKTVCRSHRDIKNLAYGLCAIMVLGDFDHRRGGHLILHELKLVVEMRPGDIIFIPSAVVTHENVPIAEEETRQSWVFYSAGGLFRWTAAGCRTHIAWGADDKVGLEAHKAEGEARWTAGWELFSRFERAPPTAGRSST